MTRGEVWWLEHPDEGRRPACIIARAEAVSVMGKVLVVPITRRARNIATQVALDRGDGMPEPCVLSLDNIQPVPKAMLVERITRLGPARLHEVCRALNVATGCG